MIDKRLLLFAAAFGWVGSSAVLGQRTITGQNVITTAVPFLTISPDSRSAALGDAGVALSPDANSIYWNPSKLVFSEKKFGASVSYTPWLRNIINDMALSYLSGYYKIDNRQAVGLAMTYFDLGNFEATNDIGAIIGEGRPREFAVAASYSRLLGKNFSLGVNLRLVNSNLNFDIANNASRSGTTAAGDVSAFYSKDLNWGGRDVNLAFGGMISNLGGKISYNSLQQDFIPTNLRLGTALTYNLNPYNKLTFTVDANKLMVPTPRFDTVVVNGVRRPVNVNANKAFLPGVFGSFSDAPGGLSEELKEVAISTGVEYWYNNLFALRGGYFGENATKGGRKYFTMGLGIRYNGIGFDFAYLFPQGTTASPLANTLRFSLLYDMARRKPNSPDNITR